MRVWNLTDPAERNTTFEPRVAEVFGIQGRGGMREYSALDANQQVFGNVNPCD